MLLADFFCLSLNQLTLAYCDNNFLYNFQNGHEKQAQTRCVIIYFYIYRSSSYIYSLLMGKLHAKIGSLCS